MYLYFPATRDESWPFIFSFFPPICAHGDVGTSGEEGNPTQSKKPLILAKSKCPNFYLFWWLSSKRGFSPETSQKLAVETITLWKTRPIGQKCMSTTVWWESVYMHQLFHDTRDGGKTRYNVILLYSKTSFSINDANLSSTYCVKE